MQLRQIALGLGLAIIVGLMVATYAVWHDGGRFAGTVTTYRSATASVKRPGYVNPKQFYWKSAEQLRDYTRQHRDDILKEVEIAKTP